MRKVIHYSFMFYPVISGVHNRIRTIVDNMPDYRFEILTDALSGYPRTERLSGNTTIRRMPPNNWAFQYRPPFGMPQRLALYLGGALDTLRYSKKRKYLSSARFDLLHVYNLDIANIMAFNSLFGTKRFNVIADMMMDFSYLEQPVIFEDVGGFSLPEQLVSEEMARVIEREKVAFDNFICVAKQGYDSMVEFARKKGLRKNIWFIPDYVDTDRFSFVPPLEGKKLKVGFVARLARVGDDIEFLFEFTRRLPSFIELHMAVGASEDTLRRHRDRFNHPNIKMHINLPYEKLPDIYHGMDVLLNPKIYEGSGRNRIEAMSCGRPVIEFRVGDPYPITDGETGFIIEKDVDGLIELLGRLNDDRRLLARVGRDARSIVENELSHRVIIPRIRKIYNTLCG